MSKFVATNMKSALLFLELLIAHYAVAQPGNYFVKYFGDASQTTACNAVRQLAGGSIYAAGSANSEVVGGRDLFLTKFSSAGDSLWTYYYGTADEDYCVRMVYNGKFFVLCGQVNDVSAFSVDGLMVAVDTLGGQVWLHRYGSSTLTESLSGLSASVDGGVIASGYQSDSTSAGNNFWLIKTDSMGTLQWQKNFGDAGMNEVSDAALQLGSGDILLSGDKQLNSGKYNAWMVKTDSAGNYVWDLLMDNHNNGGCKNIFVDSLDNVMVVGEAATDSSANFDIQVCKADLNGNLAWLKYVRASNESDAGFDITAASNGGYMLTGYYYDTASGRKLIQMMLLDSSGAELNRKLFGNSGTNIGYQIIASVNGGYIICGTDFENHVGVLIYDNVDVDNGIAFAEHVNSLSVYPNPAENVSTLYLNQLLERATISLYDVQGMLMQSGEINHSNKIALTQHLKGIYVLCVTYEAKSHYFRLVIQ